MLTLSYNAFYSLLVTRSTTYNFLDDVISDWVEDLHFEQKAMLLLEAWALKDVNVYQSE